MWFHKLFSLTLIAILLLFNSCNKTVKKFDNRLANKYINRGFSSNKIEKNGHSIFYWDNKKENSPVVVFIHGFGGDGKISWEKQAKDFNDDYRVIVPDLLWFGNSTSTKTPSLSMQIDAISTLLKELSVQNANLVGISYGGFISLGFAYKYPNRLNSVTIVDSPGSVITDEEIDSFCKSVGADNTVDAFVPENADEVKRLLNFSFHKPPKLPSFIREQTIGIYLSKYPKQQSLLLKDLPQNRDSLTGEYDVPTLILWGKEDKVFSIQNAKDLSSNLGAELTIFENAGHALPEEQHKAFNKRLKTFLND
ncbi:MAG: alpha/beta hydrolase [Brumimicrobium sp.]